MFTNTMASSALTLPFFFLLSIASYSSASDQSKLPSFILPIKKDQSTNLYYASSFGIGTPQHNMDLVIDLAGESLWYLCDDHYNSSSYHPVPCDSQKCPQSSSCNGCNGPFRPGCSNNTCGISTINPFAEFLFGGNLGEDVLYIPHLQLPRFLSACTAPLSFTSVLHGLPKVSNGIIGLARTRLTLPAQLSSAYKLPLKFSLCLPSSTNKAGFGNMLIGSQNAPKFLQTTPLIVNPVSTRGAFVSGVPSDEYFIDVKSIRIDGEVVNLKPSLLSIDKKGNGGTKISTMSPYTELQSTVYKTFLRQFLKQAAGRKMKRVDSVAPFEACFDSSTNNGVGVPSIELELQGGVKWSIQEANSMVNVKKNVVCLGFVDGGEKAERMSFVRASIIIGGHQLEDNLLVFDLESSKLSFSSSLLMHNTTCSHF